MQQGSIKQSVIVIAGMPRSGTSFTASLLREAGLDIGKKLMAPGHGNVRGFFENLDFVEFHETVLRSQGVHHVGWTTQEKIVVEDQYVEKAREIIAKHANSFSWGWKDPRTTLFLDFWVNLLPEAKFLLLYRSPWEVVDSIYRRGDELFLDEPEFAIKVWMHYNRKIIDFYDRYAGKCLLVSVYNVYQQTSSLIEAINNKFHLELARPSAKIYEQSLLHTKVANTHRPALINHYFPEALQIYQELNAREVKLNETPDFSGIKKIDNIQSRSSFFNDWLKFRRLENEVKSLNAELERTREQVKQKQAEKFSSNANT